MRNQRSAIVAFGFGEPASAGPNPHIAKVAVRVARSTDTELIFTDRDIAPHLRPYGFEVKEIDPGRVPTTYRLALLAAQGVGKYGLDILDVVALPCHMWRCLRDLRWAALECGVAVKLVPKPISGYPYDPAATTPFTRSAWQWWPPEIAYRAASEVFPEWYKRTRA